MIITQRKISELKPAEYNPRTLSVDQEKQLRASLEKFGLQDPIIVNMNPDRLNVIIGGHQRLKVWASLGHDVAPCVELNLSLADEKEFNIRLNKNTGSWDWDMLAQHFDSEPLGDWGFSGDEIKLIQGESTYTEPPEQFPEKNENIDTQHRCPKCGYEYSGGKA